MSTHFHKIKDLTEVYSLLVGKQYNELNDKQLRVLLANEYWKDGMDIEQVFSEMLYSKPEDAVSIEAVRDTLCKVFGYEPDTIIPE